jgi:hypothetical protein
MENKIKDFKIIDLIYQKNNLLKKEQCDHFINIFEKYHSLSVKEGSLKYFDTGLKFEEDNYKCLHLNHNIHIPEIKETLLDIWKLILPFVHEYINYLKKNITSAIDIKWIDHASHIRILKYSEGNLIKDHLDVSPHIRASCTINLNEDYTGGEFSFFSGKYLKTFKTGDAMIFPAEPIWVHGTKPIIKGDRYSISCFLHSFIE